MDMETTMSAPPLVLPVTRVEQDLTQMIGNTPLLRFRSLEPHDGIEIYGKAEWANPGGSVKDRPALAMIEAGERSGDLTKDKILIDATSGNTGIAYAMIGAVRGYQVKLFMSASASAERKRILRAYGAELVLTDPAESSDGAIREVRRRYQENPDIYFYPDQYNNPENWRSHFRTTGHEIWKQTDGRITHFVAGLGTSGTFMGTARRLKCYNEAIQAISMQPDLALHGLEGLEAHGFGDCAGHLRSGAGRPEPADIDRRGLQHDQACREQRGRLARSLRWRGTCWQWKRLPGRSSVASSSPSCPIAANAI